MTMMFAGRATTSDLILRSLPQAGVSKDGRKIGAAWFETRHCAALLTMRATVGILMRHG